jgi:hypothetical protein
MRRYFQPLDQGSAVARVRKLASSGPHRFADDSINILEFSTTTTTTIDTT